MPLLVATDPRRFTLAHAGTVYADGVVFTDGTAVLHKRTGTGTAVYASLADLVADQTDAQVDYLDS